MDAVQNRRRGTALENAILDAAWAELVEHGYADMTLESVAKRAGTSRPVLQPSLAKSHQTCDSRSGPLLRPQPD